MARYFQPVLDAIKTSPHPWLDMIAKLCEAVEAQDGPRISLLAPPLVTTVRPRDPVVEDLPAEVFYETMARLLFMGEYRDFALLLDWYERLSILSRTKQDQVTANLVGVVEFFHMPLAGLPEKELNNELKRTTNALREMVSRFQLEPVPPRRVYDPGELPPGSFGTIDFGRPSRIGVLGDGIRKLVSAWMELHQQLLDAALAHMGSKAADRGAKLLALRETWERAVEFTLEVATRAEAQGDGVARGQPVGQQADRSERLRRLMQLEMPLATIQYVRSPHHLYLDAFLPHESRKFGFTPYDREPPDEPRGKSVWLVDLVRSRSAQLHFALDEYGEYYSDASRAATKGATAAENDRRNRYTVRRQLIDRIEKRGAPLRIVSEDDLVSFGCAYFEATLALLATQPGASSAQPSVNARLKAWESLLSFLSRYLRTQTTHTEFNLDETPSYFDRLFPRAINGGALFDCGVYAVRMAFVFLSIAACIQAPKTETKPPRLSFIGLPLHVGLIVQIEEFPPVVIHNNLMVSVTPAEFEDWRKEWDATPDTSGPDPKEAGLREQKFVEDVAAQFFLSDVDLPLVRVPIAPVSVPPKKREISKAYARVVASAESLLERRLIEDRNRPEYQFDLRFLAVLADEKQWHDATVVPFWNEKCRALWMGVDPKGNGEMTEKLLRQNQTKRTKYAADLKHLVVAVEDSYAKEVKPKKDELTKEFRATPRVLGKGAQRITTAARLTASASKIGPVAEVRKHIEEIKQQGWPVPRFANDFLTRTGD